MGPVITFVSSVIGIASWWWMRWVKVNWEVTWGCGWWDCNELGTGLDAERSRRRGVGWKSGVKYGEGMF